MGSTTSVRLPGELVEELRGRAEAADFDGVESYIEYVLREVLHQLDDVDTSDSIDEAEVKERLETLGYLE
jgi:hypothetical protein